MSTKYGHWCSRHKSFVPAWSRNLGTGYQYVCVACSEDGMLVAVSERKMGPDDSLLEVEIVGPTMVSLGRTRLN